MAELEKARTFACQTNFDVEYLTEEIDRHASVLQSNAATGDLGSSDTIRKVKLAGILASDTQLTELKTRLLQAKKENEQSQAKIKNLENRQKIFLAFLGLESQKIVNIY